jgi:hypothetical protein
MTEQTEMLIEHLADRIRRAIELAELGQKEEANECFNRRVIPLFCGLLHTVQNPYEDLLLYVVR